MSNWKHCFVLSSWMLLATAPLPAQIVETPATFGPPKAETFMGKASSALRPPSNDPRDLNGNYVADLQKSGLAVGAPPPAAAGSPDGSHELAPSQMLCRPDARLDVSPYGGQIIQTPNRITFIAEYNHVVRRIYLNTQFPTQLEPSYAGYSIGNWDGDTLVIQTRGLKNASIADSPDVVEIKQMTERVRKIEGGQRIEDLANIEGMDRNGKPVSITRRVTILWRSDVHLQEFICEEGADRFFEK